MVLSERIPGVRSVAIGIWIRWGAAHEPTERLGISHLLEHMVFKGTERRSARSIAREIEGIGGYLDAYTTREHTAYHARVLDEHLPIAVDVLSDIVFRPLLREEDLVLERNVILEEIAGVQDTPEDLIFDLHARELWGEHPYGNPILGTVDTVGELGAADLRALWETVYRPSGCVVAAAGNVEHDALLDLVGRCVPDDPAPRSTPSVGEPGPPRSGNRRLARESAQAHICVGTSTFPHRDPRRYAAILVSSAVGGGMSSRLFQRVREELGLAYAIYAFQSFYARGGLSGVYMATRPETEARSIEEVLDIYGELARDGLAPGELAAAREQAKGQVILSLESTVTRLHRLAGVVLYDEPYRTLDELCERIDAVTEADVAELCAEYYAPDRQVIVRLGPEVSNG